MATARIPIEFTGGGGGRPAKMEVKGQYLHQFPERFAPISGKSAFGEIVSST
jgi:hypothetical protein